MLGCAKKIVEYMEKAKKEIRKIKNAGTKKSFIEICDYTLVNPIETFGRPNVL